MARISARFDFHLNLESNCKTQIQFYRDYSLNASLMQGDESLFMTSIGKKNLKK